MLSPITHCLPSPAVSPHLLSSPHLLGEQRCSANMSSVTACKQLLVLLNPPLHALLREQHTSPTPLRLLQRLCATPFADVLLLLPMAIFQLTYSSPLPAPLKLLSVALRLQSLCTPALANLPPSLLVPCPGVGLAHAHCRHRTIRRRKKRNRSGHLQKATATHAAKRAV